MRTYKKFLALTLVAGLSLSMLVGCDMSTKQPTAEELMSNLYGSEEMNSGDVDAILDYDFNVGTEVEGTEVSMDVALKMDLNLQFDENTSYTKGDVSCTMMGMSFSEDVEMYADRKDGSSTLYTLTDGVWVVEEDADNGSVGVADLTALGKLSFDDLTLEKSEEDKSVYIVKGTVSYNDMAKTLNMDMSNVLGTIDMSEYLDELVYNMEAEFDAKTEVLRTLTLSINDFKAGKLSIDKMNITFKVNEVDKVDVEIPKSVIEEAISDVTSDVPGEVSGDIEQDIADATLDFLDDVDINGNNEETDTTNEEATTEEQTESPTVPITSSDFRSGVFTLNGKSFKINETTLGELLSNVNYVITDDDVDISSEYLLNSSESIALILGTSKDDYDTMLFVGVHNLTDEALDIKDCLVYGISYDASYNIMNKTPIVDLSIGGLSINTVMDVVNVLGTPDSSEEVDDGTIYNYTYSEDSTGYITIFNVKVDKEGRIISLDLS